MDVAAYGPIGDTTMIQFGQAEAWPPSAKSIAERGANSDELALWNKALRLGERADLLSKLISLNFQNLYIANQFAISNGIVLQLDTAAEVESRAIIARKNIGDLKLAMRRVLDGELAVTPRNGDLDIVLPSDTLGALWIPIAIGAVIISGIVYRWITLEKEVQELSDTSNALLVKTDGFLCQDPASKTCADWQAEKITGQYKHNTTLADSIKSAVTKVGSGLSKGLSLGALIAIPLLMLWILPARKKEN